MNNCTILPLVLLRNLIWLHLFKTIYINDISVINILIIVDDIKLFRIIIRIITPLDAKLRQLNLDRIINWRN